MNNKEKYVEAFTNSLGIEKEEVVKDLKYQSVPEWDSVGHMELVAELEDTFNISMETDDIIEFDSYEAGIRILNKYGVQIDE